MTEAAKDNSLRPARWRILCLIGPLILFNLAIWAAALVAAQSTPTMIVAAMLAWSIGFRHAFDADHIAAIDSAARQLVQRGQQPLGVGLAFALGHSSVVVAACALLAIAGQAIVAQHPWLSTFGSMFSATFLLVIGAANVAILLRRRDRPRTARLRVRSAAVMVPVGVLFALTFDTATEVAILGLTLRQASTAVSYLQVMLLPLLFAAAMMLADTIQGIFMTQAYRSGLSRRTRSWFDVALTGSSAVVALVLAAAQFMVILAERFAIGWLGWAAGLQATLGQLGPVIVVGYVVCYVLMLRSRRVTAVP